MASMTVQDKLARLGENEQRLDDFVNGMDPYTTNTTPTREVESIPAFMERVKLRYLTPVQRGEWQAGQEYGLNDIVRRPDCLYICADPHTSGNDFAEDVKALRWGLYPSENLVSEAQDDVVGVAYAATIAEAALGETDSARGEVKAFCTPEGVAAAIEANAPCAASVKTAGVAALAVMDDLTKEPPDNKKAVTAAVVKDYVTLAKDEISKNTDEIATDLRKELAKIGCFKNSKTFTASGKWTVPDGVTVIAAILRGGGGGGGLGSIPGGWYAAGGSGGDGGACTVVLPVVAKSSISYVVGGGGTSGIVGNPGGNSYLVFEDIPLPIAGGGTGGGTSRAAGSHGHLGVNGAGAAGGGKGGIGGYGSSGAPGQKGEDGSITILY